VTDTSPPRNPIRASWIRPNSQIYCAEVLDEVNALWELSRFTLIPGKEALSAFNFYLQAEYRVSVTQTAIIDAIRIAEMPAEVALLVEMLQALSSSNTPS